MAVANEGPVLHWLEGAILTCRRDAYQYFPSSSLLPSFAPIIMRPNDGVATQLHNSGPGLRCPACRIHSCRVANIKHRN